MMQTIRTLGVLIIGVLLGVGLIEAGVRFFKPPIVSTRGESKGYRVPDLLTFSEGTFLGREFENTKPDDWIVFGGALAMGQGVPKGEWFGALYGKETGQRVYNGALLGGDGYLMPLEKKAKALGSQAQRAIFVVDLSLPPATLLNQHKTFPAHNLNQKRPWYDLKLLEIMGTSWGEKAAFPVPIDQALAAQIAAQMAPVFRPYAAVDERVVVLVVPARGYFLESGYGTIHRHNQEKMGQALRRLKNVYVVDVSYMMREHYENPLELYTSEGRLKPAGQEMLKEGLRRQVAVFSKWKSFDELSPAQQKQVKKDQAAYQIKIQEKRRKNLFK